MGRLRRLKPGRTLLWSVLVFVICVVGYPNPGRADDAWGIFIVDGFRYANISDAWTACKNSTYLFCEIWDYNLAGPNGEVMNSLPWTTNAGDTKTVDLHLGTGTLTICSTGCTPFTFVVPRLWRVTGAGRNGGSTNAGTVIQAGTGFSGPPAGRALVQVGSDFGSISFGSLLSSVTVDCNKTSNCTGVEVVDAQEQSGLEHVNIVNYTVKGLWVHGSNAQNSHYTDVEVNGCTSSTNCPIVVGTVPLEIDNVPALRPISGITVNPVNTLNTNISATVAPSWLSGTATYTVGSTSGLGVGYVSISKISASGGSGGNYNGTYPITVTGSTTFTVSIPLNPGTATAGAGNVALVPDHDVLVCSGSGSTCGDGASHGINPTTVTFVGAHFEHGQYGIDALGSSTTLDLVGGSCPITGSPGYSDVATCVRFESTVKSGHIENFYLGPATAFGLADDTFSYNSNDNYIQLYDIGAASGSNRSRHCSEPSCTDQVPSLALYGSGGTATISTTGTNQQLVLSPPGTGFVEINNAGAAANPSLVLTDTLTGFSRPGTDAWGFSSNGAGQFIFGNQGIRLNGASDTYQFGPSYNAAADTGISRAGAAALIAFGAGAQGDETALIRSANPCRITSAIAFSTSGTAFTICTFNLPAVAKVWFLSCNFIWQISAGTGTSIAFGVNPSQTPTVSTHVAGSILTSNTNSGVENVVVLSSAGALNVVNTAITASATLFQASMFGTISASGSSGTLAITATGTGTGLTGGISSGSGCTLQ